MCLDTHTRTRTVNQLAMVQGKWLWRTIILKMEIIQWNMFVVPLSSHKCVQSHYKKKQIKTHNAFSRQSNCVYIQTGWLIELHCVIRNVMHFIQNQHTIETKNAIEWFEPLEIVIESWKSELKCDRFYLFIKQTVFFEKFAGDDCFWHSFSSLNTTEKEREEKRKKTETQNKNSSQQLRAKKKINLYLLLSSSSSLKR